MTRERGGKAPQFPCRTLLSVCGCQACTISRICSEKNKHNALESSVGEGAYLQIGAGGLHDAEEDGSKQNSFCSLHPLTLYYAETTRPTRFDGCSPEGDRSHG